MLKASDIMSSHVISVKKETSLKDLALLLYDHHINGVPVMDDDGSLIGVICESDLIRKNKKLHIPTVVTLFDAVIYLESSKKFEKEIERVNATKVEDLYTKKVVSIEKETPIDEIATIMAEKKIYTIPVMEGDRLVGIVGKTDLIRTLVS